ncbi:hypothetical protein ABG768_004925, partial [Culter alburnus]
RLVERGRWKCLWDCGKAETEGEGATWRVGETGYGSAMWCQGPSLPSGHLCQSRLVVIQAHTTLPIKDCLPGCPRASCSTSLSFSLTPSFLRSFCQSLSIPFPSPLVVSAHECLLFPLSSFPHHYPASDLKPVNPLSALRAGSGQDSHFQP